MTNIIQSGTFTSDGTDHVLTLRSDVDWMTVYNYTTISAGGAATVVQSHWQRGMADGTGIRYNKLAADDSMEITVYAGTGFTLINSWDLGATPGAAIAITAGTNATRPVYDTGNTGTLAAGAIVRINSTAHTNINGLDFSVDTIVANTSFRLANTLQQAPGLIAGAGFWRYIAPDATTYNRFNPKKRAIANITQASPAVVTTLVDHELVTGQKVRMRVPAACTMTELDGQEVTVTRVNASTFSIGVDATGYTAFTFPLPAAVPFTPAEVIPFGEDTAYPNSLDDALVDQSYMGMILGATANGPAGVNNDVIYWVAGKSANL